ncbi:MAG: exonuclease subunit SbcD [Saprospiraceae bacterium]|nr:exonuclease subunit SbcD [Saprospiraceae bacterium]
MKILHTADWHLGKRLETYSRHTEQAQVLAEICDIADREAVDVVIIAGDLFDAFTPSNESTDLFYQTCKKLTNNGLRPVVAIAGNHDSPERVETADPLARACGIIFVGFPHSTVEPFVLPTGIQLTRSDAGFVELQLPQFNYPLRLLLTPYANEYRLRQNLGIENPEENLRQILTEQWFSLSEKYMKKPNSPPTPKGGIITTAVATQDYQEGVNIGIAHLFVMQDGGAVPEEPEEERPIFVGGAGAVFTDCFPLTLQYVALGHLHRQQVIANTPCPIIYCGSPLAYSFAEENQDKYVMIVQLEPQQKADIQRIELTKTKKLLRGRFESIEAAIEWMNTYPDALIDLTIVSDSYMKNQDTRRLKEAHTGLIRITPEVKSQTERGITDGQVIDIGGNMRDLFADYFKYKNKGQTPNTEIRALFEEILAEEEEL